MVEEALRVGVVHLHVAEQHRTLGVGSQELLGRRRSELRNRGILRSLHLVEISFVAGREKAEALKRAEELAAFDPHGLRCLARALEQDEVDMPGALRAGDVERRHLVVGRLAGR